MYVENRLVIIKIPFNEASIHSGDWRNNAHPSMEVCVNASRNAEQTEDTAMWVQAAFLYAKGFNALDHLYPHRPSGCPAIINSQGRWHQIEGGVDDRIAILKTGGSLPPVEEYAEAFPIPREWDGTDYVREDDGHRFMALQRVFVTHEETEALQGATPDAPKVRRNLPAGEAFLAYYVTEGLDGDVWLVSQFGSRIRASSCDPPLATFIDPGISMDVGPGRSGTILKDVTAGLTGAEVPEDAPSVSKAAFMEGGS
jgi:hypothetical protein